MLTFTNMNMEKWRLFEEQRGKPIHLGNIIMNIEDTLIREFGPSVLPSSSDSSTALVNKLITYRAYNSATKQLDDSLAFPGIITYFQQCFPTQTEKVRVHTFMIVPVHRHPDYEGGNTGIA